MFFKKGIRFLTAASLLALTVRVGSAYSLESIPETFDFGWSPANTRITADFTVRNTGTERVQLESLRPSCGCTASDFTPANLSSKAETKMSLTFNTRGYDGRPFRKPADLRVAGDEPPLKVFLKGVVTNPDAKVYPIGDGIASFEPGSRKSGKIIKVKNATDKDMTIDVVRSPADWAEVDLKSKKIPAGQTVDVEVSVNGSTKKSQETSVTFEAVENVTPHRLTIAIRTGPAPESFPRIRPPQKKAEETPEPKEQ